MKILQVYKDYYPVLGGIENHLRVLSEGLVARGYAVDVLVTSRTRRTTVETRDRLRIVRSGRLLHTASTPLSPSQVLTARRFEADLVHLHFPYPPGDLAYWARGDRAPLVITYHSDIVRQQNLQRVYAPLMEHTFAQATRIIATSAPYIASSPVLRRYADKCRVVPLSVDTARFTCVDQGLVTELRVRYGGPLALFVGRLRYYKGLHILIEALRATEGRLLIVGTGGEEEALRQQVAQAGLGERVFFAGDVGDNELPSYYAAADVFVLPAHLRAEAFGIVLLEAMAAGLPLISTELGTGTSFVNKHGVTGFVVPPGDPIALARAMQVLLANPELRAHFGAAGRARATSLFSHERMVDEVEAVYQVVLSQ